MKRVIENKSIIELIAKVEALSKREKILTIAAGIVVIVLFWDTLFLMQGRDKRENIHQQIATYHKKIQEIQEQQNALIAAAADKSLIELNEKRDRLNNTKEVLDIKLKKMTNNLVKPKQMSFMLRQVIRSQTPLRLQRLTNLSKQPILNTNQEDTATHDLVTFKHPIQLDFEGGYLETLRYFEVLEELEWQFFWDELHLKATYPNNQVSLIVHTISDQEGWMGV